MRTIRDLFIFRFRYGGERFVVWGKIRGFPDVSEWMKGWLVNWIRLRGGLRSLFYGWGARLDAFLGLLAVTKRQ